MVIFPSKIHLKPILFLLGISLGLGLLAGLIFGYLYNQYVESLLTAIAMAICIWFFNSLLYIFLIPKLFTFSKKKKLVIELSAFFITSFLGFILPLFLFSKTFGFEFFRGKIFITTTILLLLLYVMISGLVFSFRFYKEIKEREAAEHELKVLSAEAELKALKSQVNPHFLFNTLHSINALVTHNPQTARQMIARLSDLLRLSLESRDKMLVPLHQELEFAHLYLDIEKMRFGNKLNYKERIDPQILDTLFPAMVLLPLLENSVKHGIVNVHSDGSLLLIIQREGPKLQCIVANSIAKPRSKETSKTSSNGTGLANIRQRLNLLYQKDYDFLVGETEEGKFEVKLSIPLKKDIPHGKD